MRHPLAENHRAGRERLLALGRGLTESDGALATAACPAWSVKDIYAHLAGISTDIMNGNTEGAATEPWANGHVADRAGKSLSEVLDEWTAAGAQVSEVMESAGDAFPLELFVDQWTHEWDIRAALGSRAEANPDLAVFEHFLDRFASLVADDQAARDLPRIHLEIEGRELVIGASDKTAGRMPLSMFEFARACMGRRSHRQMAEWSWPIDDIAAHVDVLVFWSVAEADVIDPVVIP